MQVTLRVEQLLCVVGASSVKTFTLADSSQTLTPCEILKCDHSNES